jgi:BREX system ATP-binding protein BrxC/D
MRPDSEQLVLDLDEISVEAWALLAEQELADLVTAQSAEVVIVESSDAAARAAYVRAVEERACARGWLTARLSLRDQSLTELDALVREIAGRISPTIDAKERGLPALLEAFAKEHGEAALKNFDRRMDRFSLYGDLALLCRRYFEALDHPRNEMGQIVAWLRGVELARRVRWALPVASLSARTARRALAELTHVVRALGYEGTLVTFTEADSLTKLPPVRRELTYTVLRELIDNADSSRGMIAARLNFVGGSITQGARSIVEIPPLAARVGLGGDLPRVPTPHRPLVRLEHVPRGESRPKVRRVVRAHRDQLRALIRGAQGLPPTESVQSMTVGHERIDKTIDRLFEHAELEGSVFTLLVGDYGTGKTHLLLHLTERALDSKRPVLRLSVEALGSDLGHPERHLRRLLEDAVLPLEGHPSPMQLLLEWTRSSSKTQLLVRTLEDIAGRTGDAAPAAAKGLRFMASAKDPTAGLYAYLGASDLTSKGGGPNYRHDAYRRLLLWLVLLQELEQLSGPVLTIDESENLYRGGTTQAERRTALRSLSFYCGGTLPSACVILAITPAVLKDLRSDARELLNEVAEQETVLAWEDALMLKRRLNQARPVEVPALTADQTSDLIERVRKTHRAVRGTVRDSGFGKFMREQAASATLPRATVRATVERMECAWWNTPSD